MAEHKDKPFYIMKDEHSPMKSDWPNNTKSIHENTITDPVCKTCGDLKFEKPWGTPCPDCNKEE